MKTRFNDVKAFIAEKLFDLALKLHPGEKMKEAMRFRVKMDLMIYGDVFIRVDPKSVYAKTQKTFEKECEYIVENLITKY